MRKKIVTMDYIDIKSKFTAIENSYFKILDAYVKNGVVFIKGILKNGFYGVYKGNLLSAEFSPVSELHANVICNGSASDNNKVQAFSVDGNGNYHIWIEHALTTTETFQFIYPLK